MSAYQHRKKAREDSTSYSALSYLRQSPFGKAVGLAALATALFSASPSNLLGQTTDTPARVERQNVAEGILSSAGRFLKSINPFGSSSTPNISGDLKDQLEGYQRLRSTTPEQRSKYLRLGEGQIWKKGSDGNLERNFNFEFGNATSELLENYFQTADAYNKQDRSTTAAATSLPATPSPTYTASPTPTVRPTLPPATARPIAYATATPTPTPTTVASRPPATPIRPPATPVIPNRPATPTSTLEEAVNYNDVTYNRNGNNITVTYEIGGKYTSAWSPLLGNKAATAAAKIDLKALYDWYNSSGLLSRLGKGKHTCTSTDGGKTWTDALAKGTTASSAGTPEPDRPHQGNGRIDAATPDSITNYFKISSAFDSDQAIARVSRTEYILGATQAINEPSKRQAILDAIWGEGRSTNEGTLESVLYQGIRKREGSEHLTDRGVYTFTFNKNGKKVTRIKAIGSKKRSFPASYGMADAIPTPTLETRKPDTTITDALNAAEGRVNEGYSKAKADGVLDSRDRTHLDGMNRNYKQWNELLNGSSDAFRKQYEARDSELRRKIKEVEEGVNKPSAPPTALPSPNEATLKLAAQRIIGLYEQARETDGGLDARDLPLGFQMHSELLDKYAPAFNQLTPALQSKYAPQKADLEGKVKEVMQAGTPQPPAPEPETPTRPATPSTVPQSVADLFRNNSTTEGRPDRIYTEAGLRLYQVLVRSLNRDTSNKYQRTVGNRKVQVVSTLQEKLKPLLPQDYTSRNAEPTVRQILAGGLDTTELSTLNTAFQAIGYNEFNLQNLYNVQRNMHRSHTWNTWNDNLNPIKIVEIGGNNMYQGLKQRKPLRFLGGTFDVLGVVGPATGMRLGSRVAKVRNVANMGTAAHNLYEGVRENKPVKIGLNALRLKQGMWGKVKKTDNTPTPLEGGQTNPTRPVIRVRPKN